MPTVDIQTDEQTGPGRLGPKEHHDKSRSYQKSSMFWPVNLWILTHSLLSKFAIASFYAIERTIAVCYCGNRVKSEAAACLLLRGVRGGNVCTFARAG